MRVLNFFTCTDTYNFRAFFIDPDPDLDFVLIPTQKKHRYWYLSCELETGTGIDPKRLGSATLVLVEIQIFTVD